MYKNHLNNKKVYSIYRYIHYKDKLLTMPSNPNKQFISRQTGIPTNKYTIYFTCPIQEKFKYGKVYGKEIVSGTQDIRSKMRVVLGWAIKDNKINADEYNELLEWGYEQIKEAEKEERNAPNLNPEWVAWNEENKTEPKTKTKKNKGEENPNNCPRHLQLERENAELKIELEQMREGIEAVIDEVAELKEENHAILERKEHYKKLYNKLLNKTEPEPEPEPKKTKKTNKGKTYKTKNKVIDEVIDDMITEIENEEYEPIDL